MDERFSSVLPRSIEKKNIIREWEIISGKDFDDILGKMALNIFRFMMYFDETKHFHGEADLIRKSWKDFVENQHATIDKCLFNFAQAEIDEYRRKSSKDWRKTEKILEETTNKIASIPKTQQNIISEDLRKAELPCLQEISLNSISRAIKTTQKYKQEPRSSGRPSFPKSALIVDLFEGLSASWNRRFKRNFMTNHSREDLKSRPELVDELDFVNLDLKLIAALVNEVDKDISVTNISNTLKDRLPKKSEK